MLDPLQREKVRQVANARLTDRLPAGGIGAVVIDLSKCLLELDDALDRIVERLEFLERPEELT